MSTQSSPKQKLAALRERIDLQLSAHEVAMIAEGGSVPFNPYDLLRQCRDLLKDIDHSIP